MGLAHAHRSNAQAKVRAEPPMPQGRCERPRQCQLLKQSRSWWMAKTEIHPDPVEGTAVAATGADADNVGCLDPDRGAPRAGRPRLPRFAHGKTRRPSDLALTWLASHARRRAVPAPCSIPIAVAAAAAALARYDVGPPASFAALPRMKAEFSCGSELNFAAFPHHCPALAVSPFA
jgi:hypothetical protein